jgi:succinate dehydrogenase hydrophobic anchor subunit
VSTDTLDRPRVAAPPPAPPPASDDTLAGLTAATGLLLVVLLAVHIGSLMVRDPETVDVTLLIERWQSRWWLLADWGLLLVGTTHALLSLWRRAGASDLRRALCAACAAFTTALFLAASWSMLALI